MRVVSTLWRRGQFLKGEIMPEELTEELKRCKKLLGMYKEIGSTAAFGVAILSATIEKAEEAIKCDDKKEMLACLDTLKECN